METRQRVNDVAQLTPRRAADADAFLAAVRKEHARFIDALGQAAALLGGGSAQLEQARAAHVQLTRQFLDAQRSILQLRAETDKELALIGAVPGEPAPCDAATHGALVGAQKQQLTIVLDQWWAEENDLRRTIIAEARAAVQRYLARLEATATAEAVALSVATTRVLAELDTADAADLNSLLNELISSLDALPKPAPAAHTTPAAADDLRFVDVAPSESFVEFWVQREAVAPVKSQTRRWRFLPSAVYPVAAVASLLTVAMAWMG